MNSLFDPQFIGKSPTPIFHLSLYTKHAHQPSLIWENSFQSPRKIIDTSGVDKGEIKGSNLLPLFV